MTRADPAAAAPPTAVARAYGAIIIVGGGCYGSYYLRQLRRARERAAIAYDRIVIVDRDAHCKAAGEATGDAALRVSPWPEFFDAYLAEEAGEADAIVPSPLMPHLLFEWLERRARALWPVRFVEVRAPGAIADVPWQREGRDGTRYVSYAEWTCPVNCIEPHTCPHTRGERTWSFPLALRAHVAATRTGDHPLDGPAIFHCTHRAYGVGMIDTSDVLGALHSLVDSASRGPTSLLVGTVSHCHGALGILSVG